MGEGMTGREMEGRRGSDCMNQTAGYPEGLLPTLGLAQYKDKDLTIDRKNPFAVHKNTE